MALHQVKKVTLDIDATKVVANKADAQWTYNKNKGYMPMVGHIAETGQIVACDFRQGNAAPAKENFEFIKQCQKALPHDCSVGALRIDAAGYQTRINKLPRSKLTGYYSVPPCLEQRQLMITVEPLIVAFLLLYIFCNHLLVTMLTHSTCKINQTKTLRPKASF